ncbi:MAG TPA: multicopper oxidase domain-containing protein, partial [Terriglobales bacterium]|nr:multicopper oxidase domain-containing protein [Terriglobales bacterium]
MRYRARAGEILLFLCLGLLSRAGDSPLPVVAANDNRAAAGELRDGVLNLHLELVQGRWYPENEPGLHRDIYAFAETGRAPQSPGPLIRVTQGTKIRATIHNSLSLAARIYGLHQHPGDPNEALKFEPGETRDVQFLASQPGTYLYWAATSAHSLGGREGPESML